MGTRMRVVGCSKCGNVYDWPDGVDDPHRCPALDSIHRIYRREESWRCDSCDWSSALPHLGLHDVAEHLNEWLGEAWHRGWVAGCDDQQYGDESAHPWTPNPYRDMEPGEVAPEKVVRPRHLRPHYTFGDDVSGWCGCADCDPRDNCGCPSCLSAFPPGVDQ